MSQVQNQKGIENIQILVKFDALDHSALLFNLYINDVLLFIQDVDICNYPDDTTIYTCDKTLRNITHRLENDCSVALEWFSDNFMKLNADKYHLLVLWPSSDDPVTVRMLNSEVANSSEEKLLGVQLITNFPLTIMSRNRANRLAINFTHLPAYPHIWIRAN